MKLLVVEDDRKIAAVVKRGLEAEGFSVEVASDGEQGLWFANEGTFALILLDIMLPKHNGFQVCTDLRAARNWTPILMLTAKDGELDETESLDTGADDYLTKPFSFPVLIARVRSLLRRTAIRRTGELKFEAGDLRISPNERRVGRDDREIVLTARQFDVLEFLMPHAGEVVSRRNAKFWMVCGHMTSTVTRTWSRCMSVAFARSSMNPSTVRPSKPFGASATGSPLTEVSREATTIDPFPDHPCCCLALSRASRVHFAHHADRAEQPTSRQLR
jgi:two-component system, OmpR family, response regulator